MFRRLAGLETEYALRFHPRQPGTERLSNALLFQRLLAQLWSRVPAARAIVREDYWFLANGGAIQFERNPYLAFAPQAGLVEGATPECRGPRQLLCFQRAQDLLLSRAAASSGAPDGTFTLLKHNRDSGQGFFGSHENYEMVIASGLTLWLWRLAVVVLTPILILLQIAGELCILPVLGLAWLVRQGRVGPMSHLGERAFAWLLFLGFLPHTVLGWLILRPLAFRRQRRQLLAFLISRPVLAGSGTVHEDGRFSLSPRALAISAVDCAMARSYRPVFFMAHVIKAMVLLLMGDVGSYRTLFRARQRLQITLGDANMTQTAEFLKFGATLLVIDAIEAGALTTAPHIRRPVHALHALCADAELRCRVRAADGRDWSALEIQRFYLDACQRFVADSAPNPEADQVLALWEETLDALEEDPRQLVGKLDWVTKRYLIESLGPDASLAEKRKLDLRYHELSRDGYYLRLEASGDAPILIDPEEVLHATEYPPEGTPAALRGELIRQYARTPDRIQASWHSVIVRDGARPRVVQLSSSRPGS